MVEFEVGGHKLELYNTASSLPIKRYSQFQRYNLLESGVGSDMHAIAGHFAKLFEFITFKMHEEALTEGKNLYYNFWTMMEGLHVPGLAFCCMLHKVDGVEVTDFSEEGLQRMTEKLSAWGLTHDVCDSWVDGVKKKSTLS